MKTRKGVIELMLIGHPEVYSMDILLINVDHPTCLLFKNMAESMIVYPWHQVQSLVYTPQDILEQRATEEVH